MKLDKLNIDAIRLLELSEQVQNIINELKVMINAPAKITKASKRDKMDALALSRIEKSLLRKRNKSIDNQ